MDENNAVSPKEKTRENGREEQTETQKAEKKIRKRERGVKDYQRAVIRIIAFILILWALLFVFLGITTMPSGDMEPNIGSGDIILFYRLDKTPASQDVIVFKKTDGSGRKLTMVGRVVAVEGDVVDITADGVLLVNGNAVYESKIYDKVTVPYEANTSPAYPFTLGKDECFVLGDKRSEATDSRLFGPVLKSEILGTVVMTVRRNNI